MIIEKMSSNWFDCILQQKREFIFKINILYTKQLYQYTEKYDIGLFLRKGTTFIYTLIIYSLCKNPHTLLHASCILLRKKLEKRLCLTGTRGHPVIITKNPPKKGTKKAETLMFFEHFDYLLIGVTGFEPAASWSRI